MGAQPDPPRRQQGPRPIGLGDIRLGLGPTDAVSPCGRRQSPILRSPLTPAAPLLPHLGGLSPVRGRGTMGSPPLPSLPLPSCPSLPFPSCPSLGEQVMLPPPQESLGALGSPSTDFVRLLGGEPKGDTRGPWSPQGQRGRACWHLPGPVSPGYFSRGEGPGHSASPRPTPAPRPRKPGTWAAPPGDAATDSHGRRGGGAERGAAPAPGGASGAVPPAPSRDSRPGSLPPRVPPPCLPNGGAVSRAAHPARPPRVL